MLGSFTAMFLLPLLLLRGRRWLDRLDLAMLLSFGVSYALFDTVHFDAGVWAFYPPLIYLMVRMLVRGAKNRPLAGAVGHPPADGRARARPGRAGRQPGS